MDEKVYFRLSYETMTGDTEDFINGQTVRTATIPMRRLPAHAAPLNSGTVWHSRGVPQTTSPTGIICGSPKCSCAPRQQNNAHVSCNLPWAVAAATTGADCAGCP